MEALVYSLIFVTLHLVIALLVPQVQVVLGYNGSVFGTMIVYILPALMALKLLYREYCADMSIFMDDTVSTAISMSSLARFARRHMGEVLAHMTLLLFGVFMLVGGCVATTLFDHTKSST